MLSSCRVFSQLLFAFATEKQLYPERSHPHDLGLAWRTEVLNLDWEGEWRKAEKQECFLVW